AKVSGNRVGSSVVDFIPSNISAQRLSANVGTAGSVALVLQAAAFPMLASVSRLRVSGGTDVAFAPPIDFWSQVLLPSLSRMGCRFELVLSSRGYYPKGGGIVSFASKPAKFPLKPISITESGSLKSVFAVSHCASLPLEVAQRQAASAKKALSGLVVAWDASIDAKEDSFSKGSGLSLFGQLSTGAILSGSALGAKGKPAENVGLEAAQMLKNQLDSNRPCDSFLADQLIPFLALAKGKSVLSVSKLDVHVFSNISVCEKLLDCSFEVEGIEGESGDIRCHGVGFVPVER
ncbi:MAG: RNA 3'-terminal phosphate cyclase, partial [Candidatus Diapherotrites archaeon]|nr:RNA 3'-terminal phosphate cyclase [Candidatus Diapherotrites archaeon]